MLRQKLKNAASKDKSASTNGGLYPESIPFNKSSIQVGDYTLPYEEFGNPDGTPIVFVHGGPGGGSPAFAHRLFDPKAFHIIVYDQRGAGKSVPYAGIKDNSPDLLADDLNKLREHLHIDKWHIYGGSWGSTLALLYAEKYPKTVNSIILRGVFTMREREVDWFMNKMGTFFPESGKEFIEFLPPNERGNVLESYYRRLTNPDPAIHLPAARAWSRYETSCSFLTRPAAEVLDKITGQDALACARIEASFFRNHMFTPDDRIIRDLDKIKDIPTMIVQGRHDVICPPETAAAVAEKLPKRQLVLTPHGHATTEPETLNAVIAATDRIRDTGSPLPLTATPPAPNGPRS